MALTDKQEAFCLEYLVDLNATQAAIRAGYSEDTARSMGCENLTKPDIQERIAALKAERNERLQIDADYVLQQSVKLHERCMQEVRPLLSRKGEQIYDDEGNALFVFDASGAAKALKLIGDHVTVQAFRENIKANITDNRMQSSPLNEIPVEKLKQIRKIVHEG